MAAGAPVAGLPLWQAVLAFHVAAWIAQVPIFFLSFYNFPFAGPIKNVYIILFF